MSSVIEGVGQTTKLYGVNVTIIIFTLVLYCEPYNKEDLFNDAC